MGDFHGEVVTYSAQGLASDNPLGGVGGAATHEDRISTRRKMREFIRNFRLGPLFPYRDQLLQRWRKRESFIEVNTYLTLAC